MFFRKQSAAQIGEREKKARFERSVLCHLDAAYNLARWLVGHDQDAQDIVQEAIVRAYTGFDGYLGGDSRAWLLTIVRRTCYTFLRRNRAQEFTNVSDEYWEQLPETTTNPEALLLQRIDSRLLTQALECLPFAYREVVVLREMEGMSYREIADLVEVPVGTVMSRLARARRRLHEMLVTGQTIPSEATFVRGEKA